MKSSLYVVVLLVAVIAFNGCSGSGEKSSEKEIATFKVGNVDWNVDHANGKISKIYPKTTMSPPGENPEWAGLPAGWPTSTATVVLKDTKAKMSPDPNVTAINLETGSITVTAENGSPKTYRVQGEKGPATGN